MSRSQRKVNETPSDIFCCHLLTKLIALSWIGATGVLTEATSVACRSHNGELSLSVCVSVTPGSPVVTEQALDGMLHLPEVVQRQIRLSTNPAENQTLRSEFYYEQVWTYVSHSLLAAADADCLSPFNGFGSVLFWWILLTAGQVESLNSLNEL